MTTPAPQVSGAQQRSSGTLLFLGVVFLYLWFPNSYPGFENPNELSRVFLTQAIVERGSFSIDEEVLGGPGEFSDLARFDGHYYSDKAIGVSLLGVPVYAAARLLTGRDLPAASVILLCRLVVVTLPTLLCLGLLLDRSRSAGPFAPLLLVGLFLGTSILPLALSIMGHVPMAMLLALVFWRVMLAPGSTAAIAPKGFGWHALNGALCGAAILVDYTSALFVVLTGAVYLARYRLALPCVAFGLGALALLVPLLVYNAVCFEGPLDLAYNHMVQEEHRLHRSTAFFGIGLPRADALLGLAFGAMRGLFVHSPLMLLVLPALWRIGRSGWRAAHMFALLVVLGYFDLNASLIDWEGGWTLGPRYLIPVLPFLGWLIFEGYRREGARAQRVFRAFAAGAVAWSLLLHLSAISTWSMPPFTSDLPFPALELSWALLREGWLAPNRGSALGLGGFASLVPPAAVALLLLLSLLRERMRAAAAVLALLLFVGTGVALERSRSERGRAVIAQFPPLMGYEVPR